LGDNGVVTGLSNGFEGDRRGMTLAIATTELTRIHPGGQGVRNLELCVPEQAVYAFLGPNGAGKTTTIRLLLGLAKPDRGRIEIGGIDLAADRRRALRGVGAMVESPSLYPHLTGTENLEATRSLLAAPRERVAEVLRIVGLEDAGSRLVSAYSLGMRQRLAIAQALLGRPGLLILDEPSNGLDPAGMADMRALIATMVREHGVTVLLSSHLLDDVEKIATHVGLLHRGQLVAQGEIGTLRAERLRVECIDPAAGARALSAAGHQAIPAGDGGLAIDATRAQAPAINRVLVAAGIDVFRLASDRGRLEELFSDMTREAQEASP
jgi:ABC-2 type transport system ATP-binding protein